MKFNELLDRLAMFQFGANGKKRAHMFLQDRAENPLGSMKDIWWACRYDVRIFVPPKPDDRVLMFDDNSGVYVFKDGFCTPMGDDISHEVVRLTEVSRHGG